MSFSLPENIKGLDGDDKLTYRQLKARLMKKRTRNKERNAYYDGKNELHDIGYSLPPVATDISVVVGWPEKAVEVLANRIVVDGLRTTDGLKLPDAVEKLIADNALFESMSQAHKSALVNSCAFVACLQGDTADGEPGKIIEVFTADHASGIWDARRHGLEAALLVEVADDDQETPQVIYLMTYEHTVVITRSGRSWTISSEKANTGRIPCELLAYRPDDKRPFGRSRISRAVMSYTDSAVRTFLRSELQADLYSVGSRYLLGASKSMFEAPGGQVMPKWKLLLDSVLVIPDNPQTGKRVDVGQFQQASFQPHIDQLRNTASLFAAATSMPPDEMGVLTDNPSSAEAIDKAQKELCLLAESCQSSFSLAWLNIIRKALEKDAVELVLQWRNPATPSRAASADAAVKLVSAGVLPADSEVVYDMLDLNDDQRRSLRVYQQKKQAQEAVAQLRAALSQTTGGVNNGIVQRNTSASEPRVQEAS
ncbi:phage portal protein [Alloscardovia macacae]|uniref:Portal protein n=1 Tax=Alloscardovia macacae TaxID=1160091 RepID=A0A261F4S1_9BIFI|nr:phage portal protein [Alloscardovia macacae]OZG54112.1 portal protein [Alloscardovia macacae]